MALTEIPIELSSTPSIVDGGNATAITISSAELVTVANGLTLTDGNVVVANGHGIDFSATSGSGTSELLSDYEEGSFTGTIADASSGGNTGSTHTGYYTKIGALVTVSINLNNITTSGLTSSNVLYLRGLPFTSASTNVSVGGIKPHGVAFQSSRTAAACQISGSDTWMTFTAFGSGLSDTLIDVGDITSGASDIFATLQYRG